MKKFIFKTLIYSAAVFTFAYLIQYFADEGLRRYNAGNYGVWNQIFSGSINSDLLIQGSSRALVQFNPKIIEQNTDLTCFNMGISGGKFILQKAKWESYISRNKPPKFIIQNVDLMTLTREDYIITKEQFLPYLSYPEISSNLKEIDENIWLEKILPLYKYRGFRKEFFLGIKSFFMNVRGNNNYYKGYVGVDKIWNQDFSRWKTSNNKLIYAEGNLKFGFKFLEEQLKEGKQRGIEVIMVHAPIYIDLLKIMPQKIMLDSVFSSLASKYGMQYWDFTKDPICRDKNYFYNSTHLNARGSEIFSELLAKKLNEYVQKKKSPGIVAAGSQH